MSVFEPCPSPHVWVDVGDTLVMRCDTCRSIASMSKTAVFRITELAQDAAMAEGQHEHEASQTDAGKNRE